MKLRALEQKDAELMLTWMHDNSVTGKMQTDFSSKTIEDCRKFIENSQSKENIHLAITDVQDTYMGTVSLKHITSNSAEFAITICREAMGKGYSKIAMQEMINIGFQRYHVKYIYWCVNADNNRALRFYDKNQYSRVPADEIEIAEGYTKEQIDSYIWYRISKQ